MSSTDDAEESLTQRLDRIISAQLENLAAGHAREAALQAELDALRASAQVAAPVAKVTSYSTYGGGRVLAIEPLTEPPVRIGTLLYAGAPPVAAPGLTDEDIDALASRHIGGIAGLMLVSSPLRQFARATLEAAGQPSHVLGVASGPGSTLQPPSSASASIPNAETEDDQDFVDGRCTQCGQQWGGTL